MDSQTVGTNSIRQNLTSSLYQSEADLNAKVARESVLTRQIEELKAELRQLDRHAVKLKEISGAISNAEKSYARYIDQREEARVAALSDPKMTNVRVVARVREGLEKEPLTVVESQTVGANSIRQNLISSLYQSEADLNAKTARESVLTRQIEDIKAELGKLDRHAAKLKEISGAISSAEKFYARYVDQREEARVAALSDPKMTNVRVVHYASIPEIPVLSRMALIQIGCLLGLLVGVGLAFVLEFFDHSLNNKEDVEYYLDLPLLASIPETNFPHHKA